MYKNEKLFLRKFFTKVSEKQPHLKNNNTRYNLVLFSSLYNCSRSRNILSHFNISTFITIYQLVLSLVLLGVVLMLLHHSLVLLDVVLVLLHLLPGPVKCLCLDEVHSLVHG